jgi:DNA repair exonuclease SbcCD ATPase subunit
MKMGMDLAEGMIGIFNKLPAPIKEFAGAMALAAGGGTALLASLTMMVYSFRIFRGILGPVAESIRGIKAGFVGLVPSLVAASRATQEFTKFLNVQIAARALSLKWVTAENREVVQGIVNKALAAAAEKKLAHEKMAAYITTIQQWGAENNLNKEMARRLVLSAQNMTAANGYTTSTLVAANTTNIFSGAVAKLSLMLKGLVAFLTSWMGIITMLVVGIALLVSWIAKWRQRQEELRKLNEELVKDGKEYNKLLEQLKIITKEVNEEESKEVQNKEKLKRLYEEQKDQINKVEDAKVRLAEQFPGIVIGWNSETEQIILNNEQLKRNLELAAQKRVLMSTENKETRTWLELQQKVIDGYETTEEKVEALRTMLRQTGDEATQAYENMQDIAFEEAPEGATKVEKEDFATKQAKIFAKAAEESEELQRRILGLRAMLVSFTATLSGAGTGVDNLEIS